jgi:hypothetical protein
VILGCAALAPDIAAACAASAGDFRFDAVDCLEPRSHPESNAGTVLLNHCHEPIAILVVVCDLAAQPACKSDPVFSKGWSAHRGVEYVAPAHTHPDSRNTSRRADGARSAEPLSSLLAPYAPGLQKGRRAQIAACKLNSQSPVSQDPCVLRLAKLKRSIDASQGKSMRATLADLRRGCST